MTAVPTRSITVERRVAGDPAAAFAYFTDPDKHVLWQGIRADLDPRPGGEYVVHFNERSRIRGRYLVVEHPTRIVLTWGWESVDEFPGTARELPAGSTTVDIAFVADGDGTLIRLTHSGLPSEESGEFTTTGWTMYIERLAACTGGGAVGPDPVNVFLESSTR